MGRDSLDRSIGPLRRALPAVAWVLLASGAAAEERPRPKNVVLADLGLHVVGVGYERVLSGGVAVQAAAEWYVPWTQGSPTTLALFGVALRTRLFFHPFGSAPNGLWLSPVGTWGYGRYSFEGVERGGPMWSVGASIGYAGTLFRRLHLSIGVGGQYNAAAFGIAEPPSYARFYPTVDGTVGYAF